jgi:hypothetical protein
MALTLPQETTWKLLAVSPDMMDTQFCNKRFPFRWRSSIALSAFEPDPQTLPQELCEGRITFLKATVTITGYQPTEAETRQVFTYFPNVPTEELKGIIGQYFACYGALLTVAVFPTEREGVSLSMYPHIIDVEPKNRELIQAATETGEILTTSKSNIKTNKSLNHTESSETGFELSGMYGKKDEYNIQGKLNHKNTEEEEENWTVATDASRERQEKQGTTTQISQLYNLLSGYHVGTNRAQFLMLARPHTLEPTVHRTFVDGLRQIEGIQEFILIVARPPDTPGLCVEAHLETGHYPDGLSIQEPEVEYEESQEEFTVKADASDGLFSGDTTNIDQTHDVQGGWVVDTRASRGPDPGHEGMKETANNSNAQANSSLKNYNYLRITDSAVKVSGQISGESFWRDEASFNRSYVVFTRSPEPKSVTGGAVVPLENLLITSRRLCVCFRSTQGCPQVGWLPTDRIEVDRDDIVAEFPVAMAKRVLPRGEDTRMPAARYFLSQVRKAMTTSWRLPLRHAAGEGVGFLETDFFKDRIKKHLPREQLERRLAGVEGMKGKTGALGELTVADALDMDLADFSRKAGLTLPEAVAARRRLLGIREEGEAPPPPAPRRPRRARS